MKFTYNWLKDFVEIKITPQALADKLTMTGLEVTSLEKIGDDFVFEIEVTSNRPDWLSVVGIAREVSAITGKKLKRSPVTGHRSPVKDRRQATGDRRQLAINIQNKKDCPLYTAKIIRDVKIGPSPDWLKNRLELIGCRSINNIVDITNYILFTWGEPLHAFDLDKLVSQSPVTSHQSLIFVRRAKKGEEILSIDGIKRTLDENMLIIASDMAGKTGDRRPATGKPIAIAGIMGGKDTEVTERSKNILLEAAIFNPILIRRGRQKLGMQTDSSYRFERGIDFDTAQNASWQATKLIQELTGGKFVLAKGAGLTKAKQKAINLEWETVNRILGLGLSPAKMSGILNNLGFKVKTRTKNKFLVGVPAYRQDVNLEIDLIEEIARISGYESIPRSVPLVKPQVGAGEIRDLVSLIKKALVGLGLNEVITYSLIDKDLLSIFGIKEAQALEILNPLSKEQEVLRPSILPSLCACAAYNLNQKQDYINIFEIAKTYLGTSTLPKEELALGIALCGTKSLLLEQGLIRENLGFLHLKGVLEMLFERLKIEDYSFSTKDCNWEIDIYIQTEKIGSMTMLQKNVLDKLDIKNKDVFVVELSLDKVLSFASLQKKFIPLPKYPGIARDISFILKQDISIREILGAIEEKCKPLLVDIKIVDYYKGKQIPDGYKGLTISCLYRSNERTLTEAEINPLHNLACSVLTERFSAKIR